MATSLGKVGIVDRGNYLQEETYNAGDFVLYNGSTWLALKDGLLGAEPAEGTNWKYLARGFEAEVLSMIAANDTSGLIGEAGQQVNAQSLIDVIADKVANRLIDKGLIANNLVTDNTEMVLAAPMGKVLKEQLDEQNNNIVDGYFLRDTVNDRTKIKNTGFYQLTEDIPVAGAEYFAYSFGRQGKHWNYPVFLFNNWGDSVPLRMFQLQSADGQNYTASDYKTIITNSHISYEDYSAIQKPEPKSEITFFNNWAQNPSFPAPFGEGMIIKGKDKNWMSAYYQISDSSKNPEAYISKYNVTDKTFDWSKLTTNNDFSNGSYLRAENGISINRNNILKIGKFIALSISILQDSIINNETIVFSIEGNWLSAIIPFITDKGKTGIIFCIPYVAETGRTPFKIRCFNGTLEPNEEIYINGVIQN